MTGVDREKPALTVGELLVRLRMLDAAMPVVALYDCRCADGSVVSVEVGAVEVGVGLGEREGAVLIVE